MTFREIWDRVGSLEGETFRTAKGDEFVYRFKKTFVVVSTGQQSIPRTNFEKAFKSAEAPVQGRRLIETILDDPRVRPDTSYSSRAL